MRRGLLIVVIAVASPALAKGGVQAEAEAVAPSTGGATVVNAADAIAGKGFTVVGACENVVFTKQTCASPDIARTPCGRQEAARIRKGAASACAALCPVPTLAQCQAQSFWSSLCGVVEEVKRAVPAAPACTDEDEGTVCPPHPTSACANKLWSTLRSDTLAHGSVVPDAPVVETLKATRIAPAAGDAEELTAIVANGFADPSARYEVRHVEPSLSRFRSQGTSVHYWGRLLDDHVVFLPADDGLLPVEVVQRRAAWQDHRAAWDANDAPPSYRMDSCAEYVYEKYYDYSTFEDATRVAGADYRQFVDVAFGPVELPSSIGTRAIEGQGLRSKNGDALPVALQFPPHVRPKNAFFLPAGSFAEDARRDDAIDEWTANGEAIRLEVGGEERVIPISRPFSIRRTVDGGAGEIGFGLALDFVLTDEPVLPEGQSQLQDLLVDHPTFVESFAWHAERAMEYPAFYDEELLAYDRMRRDFEVLWNERVALSGRITALLTQSVDLPTEVNDVPFDPSIYENPTDFLDVWDGAQNAIGEILVAQRGIEGLRAETFGAPYSVEHTLGFTSTTTKSTAVSKAANLGRVTGLGSFPGAESEAFQRSLDNLNANGAKGDLFQFSPEDVVVTIADELTDLILALARLDDRLERELRRARALGCLDLGVTPCDWSPRMFAESISDQLLAVREKDFQACLAATADDFAGQEVDVDVTDRFVIDLPGAEDDALACLPDLAIPCVDGLVCDDPAYHTSPTLLERFPRCRDAYHAMYLRALSDLLDGAGGIIDPATGEVAPHQSASDSERLGDDLFAVRYAYHADWRLDGLPPEGSGDDDDRWCELSPKLAGAFDVDATVLGVDVKLIEAGFSAGIGEGAVQRASLVIAGRSLIDVGPIDAPHDANTFNVVFDETSAQVDDYFSASATFMVGPVPVKIAGGVAGIIGVTATGRVGAPPQSGGCANGNLAVEAAFAPFYGVSAFATASVDAVVVEVGVKIAIDIVTVSFPVRAGVRLQGLADNDARLTVTNDVDLVFSILGGRISAFVEVCVVFCEEFDVTLWRWAPLRFASNLFHESIDFRLGPLVEAQSEITAGLP